MSKLGHGIERLEPRRVQFVVKISKYCNLRCRYCYEYEELGNKERMSLENLELLYAHTAARYRELGSTQIEFVWHGGEPLLIPPDFYWRTFEAQRRIFADSTLGVQNVVQTNLTVLDKDRLRLLREGFDGIGVSIDLFGGLRVNAGGDDSIKKVLPNLDRLRSEKIDFGCITVLTQANLPAIRKIIQFYDALKPSSVRILPLFDGAFEGQHQGYEITHEQVLSAFQTIFEELIGRDSGLRVEPIHRYINQVIHHYTPNSTPSFYNKREWEPIYVVGTNGDLYSYAETYEPEFCHGNVFQSPFEKLVHSPGHLRAIEAAEQRMAAVCNDCRFYGSCDGYPIAEAAGRLKMNGRDEAQCVVEKGMLRFIELRLMELGVINPITASVTLSRPRTAFKHIERLPLQADVRIHFRKQDADGLGDRLMLSSGTTSDLEPPADGLSYLKVAIVPREPWRKPSAAETNLLEAPNSSENWKIGSDVGVFSIPCEVLLPMEEIFEEYGTRQQLDRERYRDHTDHPDWDRAYDLLITHLKRHYALREHEPTIVRLATAPPGMKTVTKDTVANRNEHYYVGMHLDTWEKIPLKDRREAKNRICVNLGREDRYFLFINLTLMTMYEALKSERPENLENYYGTDLGHEFMQAFPGYPVLRLRLRPREAYIAPTDNLIHDATSVGKQYPDVAMHILGYFGFSTESLSTSPKVTCVAEA